MKKIVLVHGWVTKYILNKNEKIQDFYQNLIKSLSEKFEVYFPVLPGFSDQPEPDRPYFLDDYVNYLKKYLDDYQIENCYLLGHSFGGQISAKFCYYYPQRVEKLILYNAACIRKNTFKRQLFAKLAKVFKKKFKNKLLFAKILYKILTGSSGYLYLSEIMKETMANVLSEDLSFILPKIENKTLIIWGAKDKLTPLWQGKLINKLIKNSKIIINKKGDHNFHREDPLFIVKHLDD